MREMERERERERKKRGRQTLTICPDEDDRHGSRQDHCRKKRFHRKIILRKTRYNSNFSRYSTPFNRL